EVRKREQDGWYSARCYVTGAMAFRLLNSKNLNLDFKPSFGIIYLPDQKRTGILDYYLLGSQLSNLFAVAPQIAWRLSDQFLVSGNISFNHISNGARKLPNRGINYATAGMEVHYLWGHESEEVSQRSEENQSDFSLSIASGLGIKAVK